MPLTLGFLFQDDNLYTISPHTLGALTLSLFITLLRPRGSGTLPCTSVVRVSWVLHTSSPVKDISPPRSGGRGKYLYLD